MSVKKLERHRLLPPHLPQQAGSPAAAPSTRPSQHLPGIVDAYASEGLVQFFFDTWDAGRNIYILDEANRVEITSTSPAAGRAGAG